ncbi:PREDICTED: protein GLUTAMINE DUMPER 3-like [Ipomoea nil]|uniref:protein GLUTAMINE DUMPER 3-like n=1 Tax=Ipomoea nil TaxID=35883 RepID=UPI0009018640|nr:PREDICTED: protein GLUTAMINE DUMPER 3-like [Ipomoea nil]
MRTLEGSSAPAPTSPVATSPWHSPVPYLFGGLAAMLGLIAFALLILACSYWRLSGYLENSADSDGRDLEVGEGSGDGEKKAAAAPVLEEKFLVIMAGEEKPTFIATAISSRASSFGSKSSSTLSSESSTLEKSEGEENEEKKQDDNVSQVQMGAVGPQGTDHLSPN